MGYTEYQFQKELIKALNNIHLDLQAKNTLNEKQLEALKLLLPCIDPKYSCHQEETDD